MLQPLDTLVFSIYTNPGAYALLLGSGASRAAGIPTGWEVTLDLIRRIAVSRGDNAAPDPEAWYRRELGEDLSYSTLLANLAPTKEGRQQLLRAYFEPTDEERQAGRKLPTPTHLAVGRLLIEGHVKVVITTNFDRLLETAVEGLGLTPTVISSPAQAEGALPLVHQRKLILKLHGDYLDTGILNTAEELATYDPRIAGLVGEILEDFGLIVCGWSADWDQALDDAIARTRNRRFMTYWARRTPLGEHARRLVEQRQAREIVIDDADSFFETLHERLSALADYDRPHALSAALAVEQVKKFVVEPRDRIRLEDLIHDETQRLMETLSDQARFPPGVKPDPDHYLQRVVALEGATEILESAIAAGCYWDRDESREIWARSLRELANHPEASGGGYEAWRNLILYPALRALYAGGIAALASRDFHLLRQLLSVRCRESSYDSQQVVLTDKVCPPRVLHRGLLNEGQGTNHIVPASERLFSSLREVERRYLPSDELYGETFDSFEYLVALNHFWEIQEPWMPVGRFSYKLLRGGFTSALDKEVTEATEQHPLLKAGFFGGSLENFRTAREAVLAFAVRVR